MVPNQKVGTKSRQRKGVRIDDTIEAGRRFKERFRSKQD